MRKIKWLHAVTTMHMGVTLHNIKNKGQKHSRFDNLQEQITLINVNEYLIPRSVLHKYTAFRTNLGPVS